VIEVHPSFDVETATWFLDELEAVSLKELKALLPSGTKIKDYYPNGFRAAPWEKGIGLVKGRLPVSTLSPIWVKGAGRPKQPAKEPPNKGPSQPRPQRKLPSQMPPTNKSMWQGWNEIKPYLRVVQLAK